MQGAMLLPEFDHENANTRRMLDAIPDEHLDYRPHEKSWTMRELATHVATVGGWTRPTFEQNEIDLSQPWEPQQFANSAEIVAAFDATIADAREALEAASAETFQEMWTLRSGDTVHFTMPKGLVFRFFVMNHIVHHRAQLAIYLRECDVAVPGMYGPSADEGF